MKFLKQLFVLFLASSSVFALEKTDRFAIEEMIQNYTIAWNEHGGRGFAEDFSEDADFVNIFGMCFSGKEEIEVRHIKILETFLKNSKMEITNIQLREVLPGLIIALVVWTVDGFSLPGTKNKETRKGVFTHVFVQKDGKWEITSTQNTLIPK